MSHILFVTPYYPPEVGAAQTRISETAVRLVRRGHRVTVLTTLPNYPSGVVPPEYRGGKRRHEVLDGVDVVRVWSYVRPNKGFLNRILAQISFGCLAPFLGGGAVGHPDIIIVESPPLFDAFAGRVLARRKKCPYVFTVADMWPAAAVEMGLLRNRVAIWLAERLEWSTYKRAVAVWTVTEALRPILIQRGLTPDHVFTVPNGVDTTIFRPLGQDQARTSLGWDDRFTILFAGTVGLASGLTTLLDVAGRLLDQPEIRIVLLGEGSARADLQREVIRRDLANVDFLDPLPHDQLPLAIAASDICYAGLLRLPLFAATMPVKCYEAMACARPILLSAADGLARHVCVDQALAAVAVDPEDVEAIVGEIRSLRDRPNFARQLGEFGRSYVEAHFDRDKLTAQLEAQIAAILERSKNRHPLAAVEQAAHAVSEV